MSAGVDAAHEVSEDGLDPADLAEAEQLDQLLGVVLRQHRVSQSVKDTQILSSTKVHKYYQYMYMYITTEIAIAM